MHPTDKSGADPSEVETLALYIRDKCPQLRLAGLMTIGSVESSISDEENPDFKVKDQKQEQWCYSATALLMQSKTLSMRIIRSKHKKVQTNAYLL